MTTICEHDIGEDMVILVGDFNIIVSLQEKQGGVYPPRIMEDFVAFSQDNTLIEIIPEKGKISWTNQIRGFI